MLTVKSWGWGDGSVHKMLELNPQHPYIKKNGVVAVFVIPAEEKQG